MNLVRVTKEYGFEMAHALWNYDGVCKNIHGHSYKLFVTVIGAPITDQSNPKLGMVIDFGDLKRIVNDEVVDKFDHAIMLSDKAPIKELLGLKQMFERYEILNYQPTCENLLIDIVGRLRNKMPEGVKLFSVKLHETVSSYAEWYASDNV